MRLILSLLAVANARWGRAEAARADWHFDQSDAAHARSLERLALSGRLLDASRARA